MGSTKRLLAAAAFVALAAAACVNGDASANQAADAMENAGVDPEAARCVGNRLEAGLTQEELNEVAKEGNIADLAGRDVVGPDSDDDLLEFVRGVLDRCLGQEGSEPGSSGDAGEGTDGEGEGQDSD